MSALKQAADCPHVLFRGDDAAPPSRRLRLSRRRIAHSNERLLKRGSGKVERQQSIIAVPFDNVGVKKSEKARGAPGRIAKSQSVADLHDFRRQNPGSPAIFIFSPEENGFDPDHSSISGANTGKTQACGHGVTPRICGRSR